MYWDNMMYRSPYTLSWKKWNNALSYDERYTLLWEEPSITIPALIDGTLDDVILGDDSVFEEVENGILRSCKGLRYFVRLKESAFPITIFDNHNHALYFWLEAMREGIITPWAELIHIDEHSDLWHNEYTLDPRKAIRESEYAWEFTNFCCNVGNYILPTLDVWIVWKIIRIENNHEVEKYSDYTPPKNSILNIDLDFFAPEMDFIDEVKKLKLIRNLLPKVRCITIATSPYFIEQELAIAKLHTIFEKISY